ncbi:MAG: DNA cytosine methyltransferase [Pseudomonadota bacterium]
MVEILFMVIRKMSHSKPSYYEFFAGGGMARAALSEDWRCLFANDISEKKAKSYVENWGEQDFHIGDIEKLDVSVLPGKADLAWASFPCQDLSLAGAGAGLKGKRSGVFWGFWKLMESLASEGRAPSIIVIENVVGILSSHKGQDFQRIAEALFEADYSFGALIIDAVHFVPQSRPRVFIIAVRNDVHIPSSLVRKSPVELWSSAALERAYSGLNTELHQSWKWWNLPEPNTVRENFSDIIEVSPNTVAWDAPQVTEDLLAMMSPINRAKVKKSQKAGGVQVGTLYRRTRMHEGERIQRAEVRFDEVAGCLRTPAGGSSRQRLLVVNRDKIRSRLISARETARLMGLSDAYVLPENYNEAYHLTGDGVVVPVVGHIKQHLLNPIMNAEYRRISKAA